MMQGHNIVADRWAGASNPLPNPNPHPSHTNIQKRIQNACFATFQLDHYGRTNEPTDQWTDGWADGGMDNASHRVTCLQLKNILAFFLLFSLFALFLPSFL